MTENQVGLLFSIASKLSTNNESLKKLRSHYLLRCNKITGGYGLPAKQFSKNKRCPHCCSEWSRDTDVKLNPVKLSKTQRRKRRKKMQSSNDGKVNCNSKKYDVHLNEMIQTCTFCHQTTTTRLRKPSRNYYKPTTKPDQTVKVNIQTKLETKTVDSKKAKKNKGLETSKPQIMNDFSVNLYTNAHEIFSLKNDNNTLSSSIKPASKVIKNNKKRKDKFAGLCQKAVLASAKLKQDKDGGTKKCTDNKLSLFLKPSTG